MWLRPILYLLLSMPLNSVVAIVVLIAIVVIVAAILGSNSAPRTQNSSTGSQESFNVTSFGTTIPQTNASNNASGQTRFAGSSYSQIAHILYGPNQTTVGFEAPGFNENITNLSAGTVNVTFTKLGNVGLDATFTVPKGYSLYYLEGSYGDDSPPTGEYSLIDDGVILVSQTGYVVGNVMAP